MLTPIEGKITTIIIKVFQEKKIQNSILKISIVLLLVYMSNWCFIVQDYQS